MRHLRHHLAVLERARLRLVGVDDEVLRLRARAVDQRRLASHREAGAAAAAQVRRLQLRDQVVGASSRAPSARRRSRRSPGTPRASSGRARPRLRAALHVPARSSSTIAGDVVRADELAVAVVDGDDGRVAAAAEALDGAEGDLAVLGRLARRDAELRLERVDDALRAGERARQVRCTPRRGASRPARGGTCRRRSRPPCSTRASRRARPPPRGARRASSQPCSSCARRSACSVALRDPSGILRALLLDRVVEASSVDLAHDGVERADDRDHVGDQRVLHQRRGRLAARRTTVRGTSRATASGRRRSRCSSRARRAATRSRSRPRPRGRGSPR